MTSDRLITSFEECPACGWLIPVNIVVYGMFFPPIVVAFDCPQCGKSFDRRISTRTDTP